MTKALALSRRRAMVTPLVTGPGTGPLPDTGPLPVTELPLSTGPLPGTARVPAGAVSLTTERLAGMTRRLVTARLPAMVLVPDTGPARIAALVRLTAGATVTERVRITARVPAEAPPQGTRRDRNPDPATAR